MGKVPYMIVVGEKEMEAGNISVRSRNDGDLGTLSINDFIAKLLKEVEEKA